MEPAVACVRSAGGPVSRRTKRSSLGSEWEGRHSRDRKGPSRVRFCHQDGRGVHAEQLGYRGVVECPCCVAVQMAAPADREADDGVHKKSHQEAPTVPPPAG